MIWQKHEFYINLENVIPLPCVKDFKLLVSKFSVLLLSSMFRWQLFITDLTRKI